MAVLNAIHIKDLICDLTCLPMWALWINRQIMGLQ